MENSYNVCSSRSSERQCLSDVVPLSSPYVLGISLSELCNFSCNYCIHSVKSSKKYLSNQLLSWDTFYKVLDQAEQLNGQYNIINLMGVGEPLLHPNVADMVKCISERNLTKRIEITTNASLLTPDLSLKLVKSGLTRLIISIQGITEKKYKEICGSKINFQKFIDNIRFFYENKGNIEVYIKTVDTALNENEEQKFFEIFGNYCDSINIEYTIPIFKGVDYSRIIPNRKQMKSRYNSSVLYQHCCQMIFYSLYVKPNGNVSPCCIIPDPIILGNVHECSLKQMWNGEMRKNFLKLHLQKNRDQNPWCKGCVQPSLSSEPMDHLDDRCDEILKRFS